MISTTPELLNNQSEFILDWLHTWDTDGLEALWCQADEARIQHVGQEVHLRGLVEISNQCDKNCCYCGIRSANTLVNRYQMEIDEILECAFQAVEFGYGTLVLQAGESHSLTRKWVMEVISKIKKDTSLAITLSLGGQSHDDLLAFRSVGADRYFMRFETSNQQLYRQLHPDSTDSFPNRISHLKTMKSLGFETGSGAMIDLPGQNLQDICTDLQLIGELDLDMVGLGPFIAHPDTPLGKHPLKFGPRISDDLSKQELLTYKMVALTRILYPLINIPATTAVATLNPNEGTELALRRGANIIMPNLTPEHYRRQYEIYPGKAGRTYDLARQHQTIIDIIHRSGRIVGTGPGFSPHYQNNVNKLRNTHHELAAESESEPTRC